MRAAIDRRSLPWVAATLGLLLLACYQLVGIAALPAGDFAASWPADYVAAWNPGLYEDTKDRVWYEPGQWLYGPMYHIMLLPLTLLPTASAVDSAMLVLGVISLVSAGIMIWRRWAPADAGWPLVTSYVAMWTLFFPTRTVLAEKNVEAILLPFFLLFLFWMLDRRRIPAGVLLGALVMVKYLPAIFLPWLIVKKRWSEVVAALATLAVIALIAAVWLGWENAAQPPNGSTFELQSDYWSSSIMSFMIRFFADGSLESSPMIVDRAGVGGVVAWAVGLAFVAAWGIYMLVDGKRRPDPISFSIVLAGMVILPPWNHPHYLVFLLLPLSILLFEAWNARRWPIALLVAWAMMGYVLPLRFLDGAASLLLGRDVPVLTLLGNLSVSTFGILLLVVLLLRHYNQAGTGVTAEPAEGTTPSRAA